MKLLSRNSNFKLSTMNAQLLKETQTTFSDLYRSMDLFKDEQVDVVPFAGSWTPGQVMEHILKAVSGIPQLCRGNTQPSQRPENEKTAGLKKLFLDFNMKMKSPDFIVPTETQHDKALLLSQFKKTEEKFADAISSLDLSLLCTDFEIPGFGVLTRYELLDFGLTHTQRHIHQLNTIFKAIHPAQ